MRGAHPWTSLPFAHELLLRAAGVVVDVYVFGMHHKLIHISQIPRWTVAPLTYGHLLALIFILGISSSDIRGAGCAARGIGGDVAELLFFSCIRVVLRRRVERGHASLLALGRRHTASV